MRKALDDMSPDELRREKAHQEEHFQHLVSDIQFDTDYPKTWYARWWRKWNEAVITVAKIVFGTVLICGAISGGLWVMIACLSAL